MKRQIIITIILFIATAFITVVYFKNLNPPGMRTSNIMRTIPDNASLIFEFNNDKSFYDIFSNSKLLSAVAGTEKIADLKTLQLKLLSNPIFEQYFAAQNVFVSVHPSKSNAVDLLLTMSASNGFDPALFEQFNKQPNSGIVVTPIRTVGKQGYNIYINALKKRFYVINNGDNIFSGSFSKELVDQSSVYKPKQGKSGFILLSEQQSANSLADLYVNFRQLSPLFDQLLQNKNTDMLEGIQRLPGLAALSLNFRSDAFMFNGSTTIATNNESSYLTIFANQQPIANHLKDIFPSTTACSINFALSNPLNFARELEKWQGNRNHTTEAEYEFNQIKAETGIHLKTQFNNLLGNEFGLITTRYMEKFAIISIRDGSKLKALLTNISTMNDENAGQLNYDNLPFFLLGDPFEIFKRPYFMIIDNYLILANTAGELVSYNDSYINRKFLSKNAQYNQFDNLLAGQSNIACFINFKNAEPILKRDLKPEIYDIVENNEPGWKNFYAASLQLNAAEKNFYTNFCMKLNTDTISANKSKINQ